MGDGKRFGRYEVRDTIGKGAMGVVYLAEDPLIGRKVAIKVVEAHKGIDEEELAQLQARFEREFQSAGRLSHPNIVGVHDVGQEEGNAFIAMEYVRGEGLDSILAQRRAFSFKEIADLTAQIASGLDYAHEFGIVHRDIKPANILVTREGRPKITDFGVAKVATTTLTRTGTVVGTPAYMSPEQVTGHPVTGAADQFSLAVMIYQLLTGERPFTGENPTTIMYKIVHEKPVPPSVLNAMVPGPVDEALMRAMSKNPQERYPTCSDLAEALRVALGAAPADATVVMSTGHTDQTVVDPSLQRSGADLMKPPSDSGQGLRVIGLAVAGIAVIAIAVGLWAYGMGAFDRGAGSSNASPTETTVPPVTPVTPVTHSLAVQAGEGWQIWIDGEDSGVATPGSVTLEGMPGDEISVELRYAELDPVATTFTLGDDLPATWSPPEAADAAADLVAAQTADAETEPPVTFNVVSDPVGARITLDGEALNDRTPADVTLDVTQDHRLVIEYEGYEAQSVSLTPNNVADYLESGELRFNLVPSIPPGFVAIDNPGYPVAVTITPSDGGRSRSLPEATSHNVSLMPGDYVVELSAPSVFLAAEQRSVTVESGATFTLPNLPRAVTVQVAAVPGNCVVSVDGREVGPTPFPLEIVVGTHQFTFDWTAIEQGSKNVSVSINSNGQRVVEQAGGSR